MIDPSILNIRTTTPDGKAVRWGGTEPDAERIPQGLTFGTKMPGGLDSMGCSLARDVGDSWADLGLYDALEVYGQGNLTAWEGRQAEHPADSSSRTIQINGIGHSAHLLDNPNFVEIYVDRDPNSWQELTQNQQIVLEAAGHPLDKDFTASVRRGGLSFTGNSQKTIEAGSQAGLMYICPAGVSAAVFKYVASEGGGSLSNDDPPTLYAGDDDTSAALTNAYTLTADGTLRSQAVSPDRKYLMLRMRANVDHAPGSGNTAHRYFKAVAVYGDHGLKLVDNDLPDEPRGVLGSDVVADAVRRGAPLLNFTTGAQGSIEPTDFCIPHLVFRDPATPSDVVQFVNAFHLYDWGVGLGRRFFFRNPTHYRRRWITRKDEGATISLEGPQSENSVNGIVVAYTNEKGEQKLVGPPGANCDDHSADLADPDPQNPVNLSGIPVKWGALSIDAVTTLGGAIQAGTRWLKEALETPDRGAVVVAGMIRDADTGIPWPVWCVQSGDSIRVADGDNRERRIVETNYTHEDISLTATLDNLPHQLDAIMERMGVDLIGNISTT